MVKLNELHTAPGPLSFAWSSIYYHGMLWLCVETKWSPGWVSSKKWDGRLPMHQLFFHLFTGQLDIALQMLTFDWSLWSGKERKKDVKIVMRKAKSKSQLASPSIKRIEHATFLQPKNDYFLPDKNWKQLNKLNVSVSFFIQALLLI